MRRVEEFRFCPLCAAALVPLPAEHRDAGRPACPAGHFVHYANPAVTTYAFVADDRGGLSRCGAPHAPCLGEWDLPGGFVDAGERRRRVVREIREETGLEDERWACLGAYSSIYGETGATRSTSAIWRGLNASDIACSPTRRARPPGSLLDDLP